MFLEINVTVKNIIKSFKYILPILILICILCYCIYEHCISENYIIRCIAFNWFYFEAGLSVSEINKMLSCCLNLIIFTVNKHTFIS